MASGEFLPLSEGREGRGSSSCTGGQLCICNIGCEVSLQSQVPYNVDMDIEEYDVENMEHDSG